MSSTRNAQQMMNQRHSSPSSDFDLIDQPMLEEAPRKLPIRDHTTKRSVGNVTNRVVSKETPPTVTESKLDFIDESKPVMTTDQILTSIFSTIRSTPS